MCRARWSSKLCGADTPVRVGPWNGHGERLLRAGVLTRPVVLTNYSPQRHRDTRKNTVTGFPCDGASPEHRRRVSLW